jgi:hypothetical protein
MTIALDSPWHEGERAAQRRVGVADRLDETGRRTIRPFMPDQHREFFALLRYVLVGSSDRGGRVWASLLAGPPGFIASPDARRLEIEAAPPPGDPLGEALAPGAPLGLLGIDLSTRRRNRANGHVAAASAGRFALEVEQSFGNCPKYIARREPIADLPTRRVVVEPLAGLDVGARRLIGEAATFFVASSAGPGALPDVSHRGGAPGFVALGADGALTVPDYSGNLYFNTLGNFLVHPRAGLLFLDFASGDLLQLHGATEVVWEGPEVEAIAGAERLWRFHPVRGQWLRGALALRFSAAEISPFSPPFASLG